MKGLSLATDLDIDAFDLVRPPPPSLNSSSSTFIVRRSDIDEGTKELVCIAVGNSNDDGEVVGGRVKLYQASDELDEHVWVGIRGVASQGEAGKAMLVRDQN
ncbi:hypothetical protein NL676_012159 [Syzygium grande]|nr:hypothetical protein NL676_012159 [Syzygium grande]